MVEDRNGDGDEVQTQQEKKKPTQLNLDYVI